MMRTTSALDAAALGYAIMLEASVAPLWWPAKPLKLQVARLALYRAAQETDVLKLS